MAGSWELRLPWIYRVAAKIVISVSFNVSLEIRKRQGKVRKKGVEKCGNQKHTLTELDTFFFETKFHCVSQLKWSGEGLK